METVIYSFCVWTKLGISNPELHPVNSIRGWI